MNKEAEPKQVEKPNIIDAMWRLYEAHSPILLNGHFLSSYGFDIEKVRSIFTREPDLPSFLYSFNGQGPGAISSWTEERKRTASALRKELIIDLLPLTLCVVYDQSNHHYKTINSLAMGGFSQVMDYFGVVFIKHVDNLSYFCWERASNLEGAVHLFVAYTTKSLRPPEIKKLALSFSYEDIQFSDILAKQLADSEEMEQELPSTDDSKESERTELSDALFAFQKTLAHKERSEFEIAITKWSGNNGDGSGETRIRRDSLLQASLRRYLRESGFRPATNGVIPERGRKKRYQTLRFEQGNSNKEWQNAIVLMKEKLLARGHLLSPLQKKVVQEITKIGIVEGDFDATIARVAKTLSKPFRSVRARFWEAKQRLLASPKQSSKIEYWERKRRKQEIITSLVTNAEAKGRIIGFSEIESHILRVKYSHKDWTNSSIADYLKIGESTVDVALRKVLNNRFNLP